MRTFDLALLLVCLMFSSVTRAFRSATPLYHRALPRAMSSSGEPDTSIVLVCQKKIQDALQCDSVTVTGTSVRDCDKWSPCGT
jgi:hypothetical protein